MKTKLSKEEIASRNKKIFEMNKAGAKQTEIAQKFGVSAQRIGQILNSYSKPIKNLKRKAMSVVEEVARPKNKNNLVAAIIISDMDSEAKIELLKNLL